MIHIVEKISLWTLNTLRRFKASTGHCQTLPIPSSLWYIFKKKFNFDNTLCQRSLRAWLQLQGGKYGFSSNFAHMQNPNFFCYYFLFYLEFHQISVNKHISTPRKSKYTCRNTGFTQILISNHRLSLSLSDGYGRKYGGKEKAYVNILCNQSHRVRSNCLFCCVVDHTVYEGDGTSKPIRQIDICIERDLHYCSHCPYHSFAPPGYGCLLQFDPIVETHCCVEFYFESIRG